MFVSVKWVRESDKYSVKTESRRGCMQYLYVESSNISKFVCGIIKRLCAESSTLFFDKHSMLGIKPQLQHKGGEDVSSFVTT